MVEGGLLGTGNGFKLKIQNDKCPESNRFQKVEKTLPVIKCFGFLM